MLAKSRACLRSRIADRGVRFSIFACLAAPDKGGILGDGDRRRPRRWPDRGTVGKCRTSLRGMAAQHLWVRSPPNPPQQLFCSWALGVAILQCSGTNCSVMVVPANNARAAPVAAARCRERRGFQLSPRWPP